MDLEQLLNRLAEILSQPLQVELPAEVLAALNSLPEVVRDLHAAAEALKQAGADLTAELAAAREERVKQAELLGGLTQQLATISERLAENPEPEDNEPPAPVTLEVPVLLPPIKEEPVQSGNNRHKLGLLGKVL